jgi:GAF domain-containing protein
LSHTDPRWFPNCYERLRSSSCLWKTLRAAIDASNADFGNIQLYDSMNRSLRIVAHCGFGREFLNYFAEVRDGNTTCGAAMKKLRRVVTPDVAVDPIFKGRESCGVMLRARVLAVQSTPLISSQGQFLGVMSTHYRRTGSPSEHDLLPLDRLARQLIARMEEHLLFRAQEPR